LTAAAEPEATVVSSGGADLRPERSFWTPRVRRTTGLATGAAGMATLAVAGGLAVSAARLHQQAESASGLQRAALNDEVAGRNPWIVGTLVGGVVLTAAASALLLWNRQTRE
jgi:hypothetical protein